MDQDRVRLNATGGNGESLWNPPRPRPEESRSSTGLTLPGLAEIKVEPLETPSYSGSLVQAQAPHYEVVQAEARHEVVQVQALNNQQGFHQSPSPSASSTFFDDLDQALLAGQGPIQSLARSPLMMDGIQLTKKMKTSSGTVVSGSSDEEEYDVSIRRQLYSKEPLSSRSPPRDPRGTEILDESPECSKTTQLQSSSSTVQDPNNRELKYKNKFYKLRCFYDKLKLDNEELKKKGKADEREMQAKHFTQSQELMRLRAELEKNNSQIQTMNRTIGVLEGELHVVRAELMERSNNDDDQNRRAMGRIKELEAALKKTFFDQMAVFNGHKELLERSNESYGHLFLGDTLAAAALTSNSGAGAGHALETSSDMSETGVVSTTTPSSSTDRWPSDPRLPRRI